MNAHSRSDRKLGGCPDSGPPRSPLLRLPMRINFLSQEKKPELLLPSASDRAWVGAIAKDHRRRLDEESLAGFNQSADLSTYPRKNSVRTTRATALVCLRHQFSPRREPCAASERIAHVGEFNPGASAARLLPAADGRESSSHPPRDRWFGVVSWLALTKAGVERAMGIEPIRKSTYSSLFSISCMRFVFLRVTRV